MCITELGFLPFLNASSAQNWQKTKIYKSEYIAGNITEWFCRASSVKIYAAIMVKVTFEIKVIFSLNKVKKKLLATWLTYFLAMRVIGNKQFFKVGLIF